MADRVRAEEDHSDLVWVEQDWPPYGRHWMILLVAEVEEHLVLAAVKAPVPGELLALHGVAVVVVEVEAVAELQVWAEVLT